MRIRSVVGVVLLLLASTECATQVRRCPENCPLWMTREGQTPAFVRDRDFMRRNCQVVRKDEGPEELRSANDLRVRAEALGANAIAIESVSGGAQARTTFYLCQSLPSSAFE